MRNKFFFYVLILATAACIVRSHNPHMPQQLDEILRLLASIGVLAAVLVVAAAAFAVSMTFWLVCTFLEQYSDRGRVALQVVEGLLETDDQGKTRLPETVSVGGKRPFRLSELYNNELFKFLSLLIEAIGYWPCYPAYRLLSG